MAKRAEMTPEEARVQKVLEEQQGIAILHDHENASVDIVAVPGLGAHPVESWTWRDYRQERDRSGTRTRRDRFNWLADADGLAYLFPRSRIMLFGYNSSWQGRYKTRASMKDICTRLIDDLNSRRSGIANTRPLIWIAHSMGEIVVAKALCLGDADETTRSIATHTVSCMFFATPFRGSQMSTVALRWNFVFGNPAYASLLQWMKVDYNDVLTEATGNFMALRSKLAPPIDVICVWEQVPIRDSYWKKVASAAPSGLLWRLPVYILVQVMVFIFFQAKFFVDMESALLPGAYNFGIPAGHRDIVKFESIASAQFSPVKIALSKAVSMAGVNSRKRAALTEARFMTHSFVYKVRRSLEGPDMGWRLHKKTSGESLSRWLPSDAKFFHWCWTPSSILKSEDSFIWFEGCAGIGKTNEVLATIQALDSHILDESKDRNTHLGNRDLLAYFFCDLEAERFTAETLLKSLILPLINQEQSFAIHAKWFLTRPTIDYLWRCLVDMIEDPIVSRVHLVLDNIDHLQPSASTNTFLEMLAAYIRRNVGSLSRNIHIRWLVTSRRRSHHFLDPNIPISVIDWDLNPDRGKIKAARQQYARDSLSKLHQRRYYDHESLYYIRHTLDIGRRDEHWIDIFCILLNARPIDEDALCLRKWVWDVARLDSDQMIDHAWEKVLRDSSSTKYEIEELIRVLTTVYRAPTLDELAVLMQTHDPKQLKLLIERCSPFLQFEDDGHEIMFTNVNFKTRLGSIFHQDLQDAQATTILYHSLLALRSFEYIQATYSTTTDSCQSVSTHADTASPSSSTSGHLETPLGESCAVSHISGDNGKMLDSTQSTSAPKLVYPICYFLKHLNEGFPDAAQDLRENHPEFWCPQSMARDRWLRDLQRMTEVLAQLRTDDMSAPQVTAGLDYLELVAILVRKFELDLASRVNDDGMTTV